MPSRIRLLRGGAISSPFFTIHTFDDEPSVTLPSRSWIVSIASCSAACCAISTLPSSDTDLMSQCSQRRSSAVTQRTPCARCASLGSASGLAIANTVGTAFAGNAWPRFATPRVTWI